jgi:hypothetical protein
MLEDTFINRKIIHIYRQENNISTCTPTTTILIRLDLAVEWNTERSQQHPSVSVASSCGLAGDMATGYHLRRVHIIVY